MEANWNREQLATLLRASHRPNESGLRWSGYQLLSWTHVFRRYVTVSGERRAWAAQHCQRSHLVGSAVRSLIEGGGWKVSSSSVTWRYLICFNGWLKVLQHGRTGRSSFTNNEPSRPGDVPRCSFTKQLWPPWDSSVLHVCVCMCLQSAEISPNAHSSVNAFPFPRIKK